MPMSDAAVAARQHQQQHLRAARCISGRGGGGGGGEGRRWRWGGWGLWCKKALNHSGARCTTCDRRHGVLFIRFVSWSAPPPHPDPTRSGADVVGSALPSYSPPPTPQWFTLIQPWHKDYLHNMSTIPQQFIVFWYVSLFSCKCIIHKKATKNNNFQQQYFLARNKSTFKGTPHVFFGKDFWSEGKDRNFSCLNKLNNKLYMFPWLNKQTDLKVQHDLILLSSHLADLATFPASNSARSPLLLMEKIYILEFVLLPPWYFQNNSYVLGFHLYMAPL